MKVSFFIIIVLCITLSLALVWGAQTVFAEEKGVKIKLLAPLSDDKSELIIEDFQAGQGMYTITIIETYLKFMYPYIAALIASLAVLMTIIGSIQIITAGGDSAKVTSGKERIMYAIGGLVLLLFASVILYTINPTFFSYT